jgi:hypothetical protein
MKKHTFKVEITDTRANAEKNKKQTAQDCKRFAYVYGIDISGNEKTGICIAHEDYVTVFDNWLDVLLTFQAWRSGASFRDASQIRQ